MQARILKFALAVPILVTQALAQGAPPAKPMDKDAHPAFAVATIKPHDPASNRQGFDAVGDRYTVRNQSVVTLMMFAYAIHPKQVIDAPDWAQHERWDIEGTTDTPGEPSLRQQQEMLAKLLADRFGLHFRREQRELNVFAIQVAKGGPKLKPAKNPDAEPDQEGNGKGTEQTMIFTSSSIKDLALGMEFFVPDRPVIDQTGLTGRYDFNVRYTWDENHATDPNAPPGLFTAIQDQLGLKLVPIKAPVDVFVIDHVDRPSAN